MNRANDQIIIYEILLVHYRLSGYACISVSLTHCMTHFRKQLVQYIDICGRQTKESGVHAQHCNVSMVLYTCTFSSYGVDCLLDKVMSQ